MGDDDTVPTPLPAHGTSKDTRESLTRGLEQAAAGKLDRRESYTAFADEEDEDEDTPTREQKIAENLARALTTEQES